jgi:hypothetical protein
MADAMHAAMDHDSYECAFGLVMLAKLLAGDDRANRASLARWMTTAARELDPDALRPPWWVL